MFAIRCDGRRLATCASPAIFEPMSITLLSFEILQDIDAMLLKLDKWSVLIAFKLAILLLIA